MKIKVMIDIDVFETPTNVSRMTALENEYGNPITQRWVAMCLRNMADNRMVVDTGDSLQEAVAKLLARLSMQYRDSR